MRAIGLALLALVLQLSPASAQDQWRTFRSDSDGFSVEMPRTPTITSRRIGKSGATQTMFLIEDGPIAYLVSVIQMAKGTGPKNPDSAYFQNLLKNYTEGSKTTLRTSRPATVAGKPGIDGISDVGQSAHLVQIAASGDRVYMLVYAGAKGQERGPEATRFRESFKITN
jgi:hypothetical protein